MNKTRLFVSEFKLIIYRSIALEMVYQKSFECNPIQVLDWL